MTEMEARVKKLTTGQGGVDWHYIRATSEAITSTTRSCRDILPLIGISTTARSTEEECNEAD